MRIRNWIGVVAMATAGVLLAVPAAAQFQKPEDAVRYRQGAFTVMAAHFGRIAAVVKGKAPYDADQVAANADIVETMAALPFTAFGPGTDVGKTRAKPEIWTDRATFDKAAEDLKLAVANLSKVAEEGNEAGLKAAFGGVGKACKGCHDKFRTEQ